MTWRRQPKPPRSRDDAENAATNLYAAAVAWVATQMWAGRPVDEDDLDPASPVVKASIILALLLMRSTPARYGTRVSEALVSQAVEDRVEDIADGIAKDAVRHAKEHWKTIEARVQRDDPTATVKDVAQVFISDTPWQRAAARTLATRQAAETALSMVDDVNKEAEEDHRVVWISRGDHKVRLSHRRLHGKHRKPGSSFKAWPDGQRLAFPGDPRAPLDETINCRCALILVPTSAAHQVPDTFRVSDEDWGEINKLGKLAKGPRAEEFFGPVRVASAVWSGPEVVQAELDLMEEMSRV